MPFILVYYDILDIYYSVKSILKKRKKNCGRQGSNLAGRGLAQTNQGQSQCGTKRDMSIPRALFF
jgi:hypothetical protein